MWVVVLHPYTKFEVHIGLAIRKMAHDIGYMYVSTLIGLLILTFDLLTLELVYESHLRWGTFLPNLDTLGLGSQFIFCYVRDGRTDRRTDGQKQRLGYFRLPYGRHIIIDSTK